MLFKLKEKILDFFYICNNFEQWMSFVPSKEYDNFVRDLLDIDMIAYYGGSFYVRNESGIYDFNSKEIYFHHTRSESSVSMGTRRRMEKLKAQYERKKKKEIEDERSLARKEYMKNILDQIKSEHKS